MRSPACGQPLVVLSLPEIGVVRSDQGGREGGLPEGKVPALAAPPSGCQGDLFPDQSPAFGRTEPEPVPGPRFASCPDFDQSVPDHFDD